MSQLGFIIQRDHETIYLNSAIVHSWIKIKPVVNRVNKRWNVTTKLCELNSFHSNTKRNKKWLTKWPTLKFKNGPNKLLCKILKAHINVDYCSSVKAIKYITKYINKGSDMATFAIGEGGRDEIKNYQTGCYILKRVFGLEIPQQYPTVVNLAVHLENGQRVYFIEDTAHNLAKTPPETTLTAFFKLCQQDGFAKSLMYVEVPTYYTWTK